MSLPTPKYNLKNFQNVYEPSEDTFLMLDALESEFNYLKTLKPLFVLEIGSGSGVIITSLGKILNNSFYFASDINIEACRATLNTGNLNNLKYIDVLNTNLNDGLREGIFDLLIFNPPYVVTESDEYNDGLINKAWAGGLNGREIIDKFLLNLTKILSNKGVCYLLLLKENNIDEIKCLIHKFKFKSSLVIERKIPGEHLFVLKINRI